MNQTRTTTIAAAYGGTECGPFNQTISCNTQKCPAVNCTQTAWSEGGGNCSVACGGGTMNQTRITTTPAAYGGTECGPSNQTISCNTQACPVDCIQTAFSGGNCSAECGGGTMNQTRNTTVDAAYGGTECGPLSQTITCNTEACISIQKPSCSTGIHKNSSSSSSSSTADSSSSSSAIDISSSSSDSSSSSSSGVSVAPLVLYLLLSVDFATVSRVELTLRNGRDRVLMNCMRSD